MLYVQQDYNLKRMKIMADNNQNKAEQYRQERKERLAKSAKKNAKNIEKKVAARSVVKKVIAIIVIAAIALGCVTGILNYCGVLQKAVQVGYVGNEKISYAEYLYYYSRAYNQLSYNAQYYKYYGYDYGYDTSLAPQDQTKTTKDEDGNEITWVEYLHDQAVKTAQMYLAFYQEAKEAGTELTEADLAEVDKQIEDLREEASTANQSSNSSSSDDENQRAGYSLNAYLRKAYGNGVTERFLKKQLKMESLVKKFYNDKSDEFEKGYTEDEVKKVFDESPDSYQFVTLRLYQFKNESLTQNNGESDDDLKKRQSESDAKTKANANEMFDGVTDEKSFVTLATKYNTTEDYDADSSTLIKAALKSQSQFNSSATYLESMNSDLATWAFEGSTKAGDKKLIEDSDNGAYYVALMVNPKHDVNTVTVRHILFLTQDSKTGKALSDDEIQKAKDKASETLAKWKAGEATEDSFATFATDLTEDTGSSSNGGLYENVVPGQMTGAFDKWIFDDSRKAGDTDIVESEYGYHIIYFVSKNGTYADSAIRSSLASEDLEKFSDEILESDKYVIGVGPKRVNYIEDKLLKKYKKTIARSNASSSSKSSAS